jgi:hypothetical protein
MRQTSKYSWEIVSDRGHVLQSGISLGSRYRAEDYVKRYVSSFHGWTYEIMELKTKKES